MVFRFIQLAPPYYALRRKHARFGLNDKYLIFERTKMYYPDYYFSLLKTFVKDIFVDNLSFTKKSAQPKLFKL